MTELLHHGQLQRQLGEKTKQSHQTSERWNTIPLGSVRQCFGTPSRRPLPTPSAWETFQKPTNRRATKMPKRFQASNLIPGLPRRVHPCPVRSSACHCSDMEQVQPAPTNHLKHVCPEDKLIQLRGGRVHGFRELVDARFMFCGGHNH